MAVGKINDRGTMYEIVDTEARDDIQNVRDSLSLVATTGEYNDLLNKPTIDNNTSTTSTNAVENQAITNFVNSSVATNTANFIGTYNSLAELEAHEDYTKPITNNDYGFVISTDSSGNTLYSRYKYNSEEAEWKFEYSLNNSSFTAEQWATINSGVIAADKTQIGTNTQNINTNTQDILVLKNSIINKLEQSAVASVYDSNTTYTDGDLMTYKGELYKCDSVNGQPIQIGENLLVTYADRLKDSTYGYRNSYYWESYGNPGTSTGNDNMYISGSIPIKQNTTYGIYESGWSVNDPRYYALAMFTNGTNGQVYARALTYGYNGAATSATVSSGSYQYISMSIPKNEALAAQYSIYELSSQKFIKITIENLFDSKVDKETGKGLSTNDFTDELKDKLDGIENGANKTIVDTTLSDSSTNPVQNKVITTELNTKQDVLTFDDVPTANSNNPVKSSGIKTALDSKANDSDLSTVAKTGSYNDLLNKPIIDSTLSTTSENAVQNKVITENVNTKLNKSDLVELTQAEWDALDNSKYSDNKVYFITDGDYDPIDAIVYGYHIDPNESDPSSCVSYLADAIGMTPASMGTTTFDYGSWSNAFFMPKPCMVKSDGTVDYYLDPNDYTKKADGTASDITDLAYDGNAMIEWPLIWWKYEAGSVDGEGYFYVSNKKIDNTYHCWCNYDSKNNIINHFYTAIYNGGIYNGKLRSMSGYKLTDRVSTVYSNTSTYAIDDKVLYNSNMYICITAIETPEEFDPTKWEQLVINGNTTGTQEVNAATANNTTSDIEWYIDTWSDRMLINGLLILMGKSLNVQATFGQGITSGSQTAKNNYTTGSLNDKGMFYGSVSGTTTAVKVFGMENWWGLTWHRTSGLLGTSTGYVYKMTYNNIDGSTATSYNSNGSGYLTLSTTRPSANNYVNKMKYGPFGYISIDTTGGSSTTNYCDYYYGGNGYLLVGGPSTIGAYVGASCFGLAHSFATANWSVGACLSLKPLANPSRL